MLLAKKHRKNNKQAGRYFCHVCYLKLFELCNENDNICENVFQMPLKLYSTPERERGKEMKIPEIDGFFIHFLIKEAPQNCENVCRKYNVSNYVPSWQKLC